MAAQQQISRMKTWCFRGVCIAFPLVMVTAANAVLFVLDVGHDTRLLVAVPQLGPGHFQVNRFVALRYADTCLSGPGPRVIQIPARPETYRVVVLGASSVQGFPFPSELSFPAHLEVLLRKQLRGQPCEVLNLGFVAMSTSALVSVLQESLAMRPNVIVVYAGHNEFYGFGGRASNSASLSWLRCESRRFRLVQLLSGVSGESPPGELATRLPSDLAISRFDPRISETEEIYAANLRQMVMLANDAGIPMVLCSVASNLRDQSPLHSIVDGTLEDSQRVKLQRHVEQAAKLASAEPEAAISELRQAFAIDDGNALVAYRLGQSLEDVGRMNEAAESFRLARDLDGCRFRAPGSFRGVVAQTAEDSSAVFIDVAQELAEVSEFAAPGHDLFIDHVHFSHAGNHVVAKSIARALIERVRGEVWDATLEPSPGDCDTELHVTWSDHMLAFSLIEILPTLAPLNGAPDVARHAQWARREKARFIATISDSELRAFDLQMQHCIEDPTWRDYDVTVRMALALIELGDIERAVDYARHASLRQPFSAAGPIVIAGCCCEKGDVSAMHRELAIAATRHLGRDARLAFLEATMKSPSGRPVPGRSR